MSDDLKKWEIIGIIATLVIVLAIPFYLIKEDIEEKTSAPAKMLPGAAFGGRQKCIYCHKCE